jgi:predicted nucleic acid-binding protein
MKLFFDSDIILDVLLRRSPHSASSSQVLGLASQGHSGFVAPHSIAIIHYVCHKQFRNDGDCSSEQKVRNVISKLLVNLTIATLNEKIVKKGLVSSFKDFEDSLVYYCAESVKSDVLITRNINDYPSDANVSVVLPEALIEMIDA